MMQHYNIPIFVPHKGCPHDCVFCNQRQITGQAKEPSQSDIGDIITSHLKTIKKDKNTFVEIAFFGGSFTAIGLDKQTMYLESAYKYIKSGQVDSIRCSTRPDCIDKKILENLKKYNVGTIELGVQSTDPEVLLKSERGHSADVVFSSAKMIKSYGFNLGLQMMTGLIGDTWEKSIKTAEDIISLKPDCVRIYPTLVIRGTKLFEMYEQKKYFPFSLADTIKLVGELLKMFHKNNINVIRIGLQTTSEINENTVIGPYHPSLKELIMENLIKEALERFVIEKNISNTQLDVYVSSKNISNLSGIKKSNKIYFYEKYKIKIKSKKDGISDDTIGVLHLGKKLLLPIFS